MYSTLLLEIAGNLATITLNRPDKRNAISTQMMAELQTALDQIEKSHARVAILTGNGKAFCAGMDLDMLACIAKQSPAENQEDSRRIAKMFRRIWSFPRPLIAVVKCADSVHARFPGRPRLVSGKAQTCLAGRLGKIRA